MAQVVVTGATGRIGRSLVRSLSVRGVTVRALTRAPDHQENLAGVTWVRADLSVPETLPTQFAGADRLFLLTPAGETMVKDQHNAIRSALAESVRHVVKLSALGASDHSRSLIAQWHYAIERELLGSGLDWTILRPHYFMDNLLDQAARIRGEGRILSPVGPGKIPFIDSRDIADVATETLTGPDHAGRKYVLTGGRSLSYSDVATLMSQEFGREIAYEEESPEATRQRLISTGAPTWEVESTLALFSYQRAGGPTALVSSDVERLLGRVPRTLSEFLRDHRAAFSSPS